MKLTAAETAQLNALCKKFRIDVLTVLHEKQTGHPGGSLSVCEILTTLYFKEMNVRPDRAPSGQSATVSCCRRVTPRRCSIACWRKKASSRLRKCTRCATLRRGCRGIPARARPRGVDASTGPLGIGLSAAVGMAVGLRMNGSDARVYAILGDGEIEEGTIWEACMSANKFKVDNLCAVLDWNGVQLDGTNDEIMPLGDVNAKFRAFGWHTIEINGHDVEALHDAFEQAKTVKGQPTIILAHTVKGKGVSFMEGKSGWHGKAIDDESFAQAMKELGGAQ